MKFIIFFFTALLPLCMQAQTVNKVTQQKEVADNKYIVGAFNKADEFMNTDHYDSAQFWLNKIYLKVSYRKPSMFSYFLTSRQAEVYYYNNLHELGLQEALKAENIASVLKDSILIADANNFIGLFNMNNNKLNAAIIHFKKSLLYIRQPPYNEKYLELSKPHHIYGNLAEAFEKSEMPDSAVFYSQRSLQKATEIKAARGIATALLNLGNAFLIKKQLDSAIHYFNKTRDLSKKGGDFDVELNSYSGLADCALYKNNKNEAFKQLELGFKLLNKYPQLNDFYASMFLDVAVKVYKKYNERALLIKTLTLKTSLQSATYNRNNTQIQTILSNGIQNEKRIFNLELAESRSKQTIANTRLYIVLLVFLLFVIAFIAFRYFAAQKLRVANLRNKISQDLHDEVGATLSGIAMYSYITKDQINSNEHLKVMDSLDIIKDNAGEMVAKLNDIVWAVNPKQDTFYALIQRLKDFALQIAGAKNINVDFVSDELLYAFKLPMQQRKDIYLICKEAINNAVKYSNSTVLKISFSSQQKNILIVIEDKGIGFPSTASSNGNGLINMSERAKDSNVRLNIESKEGSGTKVTLEYKNR